ncbi:MAG TPA: GNAT family N-acetyltransferase [Actinomycetota bacterium]|nr:GNAT family N-acetyltransferase [Actinomycetota bacterium]
MNGAVSVRPARSSDWAAVAALLAELGRPAALGAPEEPALREVFEAYRTRADAAALVAESGGRIIGFCDVEFRVRLNFVEPQAWVPDLIVTEAARGTGAGRALLAEAERLARERGCWGMTLESAAWRTAAHAFYRHTGWTDAGLAFTKPLSDRVWPPPAPSGRS